MKQNIESLGSTMSVSEMRRLLGFKKTEGYWLVHRNCFETRVINGRMRVDRASFEKWYANQVKHKKVNGEPPGEELRQNSFSFRGACGSAGNEGLFVPKRSCNLSKCILTYYYKMGTTGTIPLCGSGERASDPQG